MDMLSDRDKSRTRYHLVFVQTSFAASLMLGIPKPMQTIFLIEDAMSLLVEEGAVARVRCILDTMDGIEGQLRGATTSLLASELGNLKLHPLASRGQLFTDSLEKEYVRLGDLLARLLGCSPHGYSYRD